MYVLSQVAMRLFLILDPQTPYDGNPHLMDFHQVEVAKLAYLTSWEWTTWIFKTLEEKLQLA